MLDKQQYIWLDGNIVEYNNANFHLMSHSLHYGSAVFEGERAYNGKIFAMDEHHKRLHKSAKIMHFEIPYSVEEINHAALEIIKANKLEKSDRAYIRPIAWRGESNFGILAANQSPVHLAIITQEWPSYRHNNRSPLRLDWSEWVRPPGNSSPYKAKASGTYAIGSIARQKALASGYDDVLMLDYRGYVAECPAANIFMVQNQSIYTPIADCFLDGITRQKIIFLAQEKLGIRCEECRITPEKIMNADEIFITGSAAEVFPIGEIAGKSFNYGVITKNIIKEYLEMVAAQ